MKKKPAKKEMMSKGMEAPMSDKMKKLPPALQKAMMKKKKKK